jgi:hypothetical protein
MQAKVIAASIVDPAQVPARCIGPNPEAKPFC